MENKKDVVAPGKEESISLKENKVILNNIIKKKPKQIQLQKLDLGTNPINISSSNGFLDINYIFNFIKIRIRIILLIIFIIFFFVLLFSLKGIMSSHNDEEEIENNDLQVINSNINSNSNSNTNSNSNSNNITNNLSSSSSFNSNNKNSASSSIQK